ncbi:hypothetical protein JT358_03280 [Micrococcales bacterium 31B]|nr:hypothetical protein [Micrococcales bacterium 31B]
MLDHQNRSLLVLDDDPTGSQCVRNVDVVFDPDPALIAERVAQPGETCFVLTNSRSLDEADAVARQSALVSDVLTRLRVEHYPHLVSRSDSTLRGHVIAEVEDLAAQLAARGVTADGVIFVPAMLEAGRFTRDDVHFAVIDGTPTPAAETHFATDATFGYRSSNLKDFLVEKSGGRIARDEVASIGLADIREGRVEGVAAILRGAQGLQWIVVNAEEGSDLDTVAAAQRLVEAEGKTFITRCGPSYVRPLAGQESAAPLTAEELRSGPGRLSHGVVVVGSHVDLTTAQLEVLQSRGGAVEVELDAARLLAADAGDYVREQAARVAEALRTDDVVVYTSRALLRSENPAESLAMSRTISDGVVALVAAVMPRRPAWVVAKGGITSHEVAAKGLGMRRGRVVGQFFTGQISLVAPVDAPEPSIGCPYVVFPGNVGGRSALADVVERLRAATAGCASN